MAQETETGLCINLETWHGEGDEREVQKGGDICIHMADSCCRGIFPTQGLKPCLLHWQEDSLS